VQLAETSGQGHAFRRGPTPREQLLAVRLSKGDSEREELIEALTNRLEREAGREAQPLCAAIDRTLAKLQKTAEC
jgi:hypothetical protein